MSNKNTKQSLLPPPVVEGMVNFQIDADAVPDHGVVISASYPDSTDQDKISVHFLNTGITTPDFPYFYATFWSSSGKAQCAIPKEIILTAKNRGTMSVYYDVIFPDTRTGISNLIAFEVV